MKIMVVSDTHGNYLAPLTYLDEKTGVDLIVHLGDEICDGRMLKTLTTVPVIMVPGNCDPDAREPRDICTVICGQKVFITHGDRYSVKAGLDALVSKASLEAASVVLFGHTHLPLVQRENGLLLVNPGTMMAASKFKSYAVLTITQKNASAEIIRILEDQQPQPQL